MAGPAPLRQSALDIASLPRVPIGQTSNLPAEPGVYLAIDDANRVWYVGTAESIRERLRAHNRMDDLKRKGVTCIAWKTEEADSRRKALEKEAIKFLNPPLNVNHREFPVVDLGLTREEEIDRFFQLRIQHKRIETELEALKPNIVTHCEQSGGKIVHRFGTIQPQEYKSWQYSDEVELLRVKLKRAEQEERDSGKAKVKATTISPVVRLNAEALGKLSPGKSKDLVPSDREDEQTSQVA